MSEKLYQIDYEKESVKKLICWLQECGEVSKTKEKLFSSFPYYRQIGPHPCQLNLRLIKNGQNFAFSFDLTKKGSLSSLAWFDCSSAQRLNDPTKKVFAKADFFSPVLAGEIDFFRSNSPCGLYVVERLRGLGIGTALVTSSRILLAQMEIETLVFDGIGRVEDSAYSSEHFYRHLHSRFLGTYSGESIINGQRKFLVWGRAALPTRETPKRPYLFPGD